MLNPVDENTLISFFIYVCHEKNFKNKFILHVCHLTYCHDFPAQMMLSSKKKKQSHFRSVISDIFDGSILSLVQCLTCDRVRCTAPSVTLEGATYQHTKQSTYTYI